MDVKLGLGIHNNKNGQTKRHRWKLETEHKLVQVELEMEFNPETKIKRGMATFKFNRQIENQVGLFLSAENRLSKE